MPTAPKHDYYALLGVRPEIGFAELRRVWRRLAKSWHPDHAGHTTTATFQNLSAAYEVLSVTDGIILTPSAILHGMLRPITFRVRLRPKATPKSKG